MVVTRFVPTETAGIKHERTATPSRCTVQAPHSPMPQPYLVPVSPKASRSTHKSGVSGSISNSTDFALTDNDRCVTSEDLPQAFQGRTVHATPEFPILCGMNGRHVMMKRRALRKCSHRAEFHLGCGYGR